MGCGQALGAASRAARDRRRGARCLRCLGAGRGAADRHGTGADGDRGSRRRDGQGCARRRARRRRARPGGRRPRDDRRRQRRRARGGAGGAGGGADPRRDAARVLRAGPHARTRRADRAPCGETTSSSPIVCWRCSWVRTSPGVWPRRDRRCAGYPSLQPGSLGGSVRGDAWPARTEAELVHSPARSPRARPSPG